ncbi:MAG: hypothetical protein JWM20_133 [Patescibacteria group bacterium]|nr:hypothetical protein [Patescibacteria group bacterium]
MKRNILLSIAALFLTITACASAPLLLTYPNSGSFAQGAHVPITWRSADTSKPIFLALISQVPFKTQQVIAVSVPYNGGSYANWTIPSTMSPGSYMVYVQSNRGVGPAVCNYGGLITVTPAPVCTFGGLYQVLAVPDSTNFGNLTVPAGSRNIECFHFKLKSNSTCDISVIEFPVRFTMFSAPNGNTLTSSAAQELSDSLNGAMVIMTQSGTVIQNGQSCLGVIIPAGTEMQFIMKASFPNSVPSQSSLSGITTRAFLSSLHAVNLGTGQGIGPNEFSITVVPSQNGGLLFGTGIITIQ